jgi:hypothetical protein
MKRSTLRTLEDFLISPRDFLKGCLLALFVLIAGSVYLAFWLAVAGFVLYRLILLLWDQILAFGQWLWSLLLPG